MTQRKYVIGFNGPPGCGKDTAGKFAEDFLKRSGFDTALVKMAEPLKEAVNEFCNVPNPHQPHEELKTQLVPYAAKYTDPVTFRQAYINFSELFAKPTFGEDVFGQKLAADIRIWESDNGKATVFIITDVGFEAEQYPVIDEVGQRNYALIQLYREGCTFDGDSRAYVDPQYGYKRRVWNKGSLDNFRDTVRETLTDLVNVAGWYP